MNEVKGYRLIQKKELPEINSIGYEMEHVKSGAHLCLIENPEDTNKVFTIGFNTPPEDDSGIPHIIEHSVLCGSDKFPLKDPFVVLAQSSLNTFLNAMTYPDRTLYPVASTNEKDLRNLIDVYMDAVFHPAIRKDPRILMQEGWHYELQDKEDEIGIVGVVYNEMKGAYSSADGEMFRSISQSLFPGTPYEYESGGHPDAIPTLTQEHFLDFYHRYYHPSNSYIYLYGDMDMAAYLTWLDEAYLSEMDRAEGYDPKVLFPDAKPFSKPIHQEVCYSVDAGQEENEGYLTCSFALNRPDPKTAIALDILEYLLLEMQSSPLKNRLIECGLGRDIDGSTESSGHHVTLSIIARGVDVSRQSEFEKTIRECLEKIVEDGFDPVAKLAALNRTEFSVKESDHGTTPEGLIKGMSYIYPVWTQGEDPFAWMEVGKILSMIREEVLGDAMEGGKQKGLLEKMIQELLLDNPHVSYISMKPVVDLAKQEEEALAQKLQKLKEEMSEEQVEELVRRTQELLEFQETPDPEEALACIPHLSVSDIREKVRDIQTEEMSIGESQAIFAEGATNGVLYLNQYFDLGALTMEELSYASFLTSLIGCMDTEVQGYQSWSNQVQIHTGGIAFDCAVRNNMDGTFNPELMISGKCLVGEEILMQQLIAEALTQTRFTDLKRYRELLFEEYEGFKAQIENNGMHVAMNQAEAQILPSANLDEKMNGLSYFSFIHDLCDHFDEKAEDSLKEMERVARKIFVKENISFAGGTNASGKDQFQQACQTLYDLLPEKKEEAQATKGCMEESIVLSHESEGIKFSGKVLYNVVYGSFQEEYTGAMQVAAQILSLNYLWGAIRVQGGAYGAFAGFNSMTKLMYMASYRDPKLAETYAIYKTVGEYLRNFDASPEEMEKYILGTMSNVDVPWTPAMTIRMSTRMKRTQSDDLERRQRTRSQILHTTPDQIRELGDVVDRIVENSVRFSFGNKEEIQANQELFDRTYEVYAK